MVLDEEAVVLQLQLLQAGCALRPASCYQPFLNRSLLCAAAQQVVSDGRQ